MDRQVLLEWIEQAVKRMILDQWELAPLGVGERTVTSHLARYLAEIADIPDHMRVDHEYNRHADAVKRIGRLVSEMGLDPEGEQRIYPDIVVHRRGDDSQNWLVIEAKKGHLSDELDRMKVYALLEEYSYQAGALLSFGMNANGWQPSLEWIGPTDDEERVQLFDEVHLEELNRWGEEAWIARSSA